MHPREKNPERYVSIENLSVDKLSRFSQESIVAGLKHKPAAVIGFSSTTLVSLKILYDIETISISRIVFQKKIGPQMKTDCKKFVRAFGDIVNCPSDINGVVSIICRILNK